MKLKKFKNVGGSHQLADKTNIAPGEIFMGPADLRTKFPNKFKLVITEAPDDDEVEDDDETSKTKTKTDAPKAKDVTKDFANAAEHDLKVMKTAEGHMVYDGDDKDPATEAPLNKKDTKAFIAEYVKA